MRHFFSKEAVFVITGFTLVLLLAGCGYKPSSHYMKNLFADTIYVKVNVDAAEPENAPFIKDEMNRMVINRLKAKIVPKAQAKSQIIVSYNGSRFVPVALNKDGYIVRYRADVRVHFDMITKHGKLSRNIHAVHEADIQASSYFSSKLRTEAIRKGLEKALDQFLAFAAVKGMIVEESEAKKAAPLKK